MTDRPNIADYMARDLVTLTPDMEINRALHLLLNHKISGAPVLDDDAQLVGVLSKKDCLRAALNASYYQNWGDSVASYMSTDVHTLDAGLDIVAAAESFLQSNYRRFPVMQEGRLVGQISRADVLRALADQWG
ncbi:CBS domain-containing protein [Defluviimonas aestuarii]|uniref:CBS domain-containing protein n=1 Tax=Albidovulum aestuarii TaxID=1130726 RepID=UPI00249A4DE5|nr:CBS domain-containing protein [Defluviimonas aestuarii]MDI3338081.1 CBS domain-containing protein [Defluviimonas aestuarii]